MFSTQNFWAFYTQKIRFEKDNDQSNQSERTTKFKVTKYWSFYPQGLNDKLPQKIFLPKSLQPPFMAKEGWTSPRFAWKFRSEEWCRPEQTDCSCRAAWRPDLFCRLAPPSAPARLRPLLAITLYLNAPRIFKTRIDNFDTRKSKFPSRDFQNDFFI